MTRLLIVPGSTREASLSKRLAGAAYVVARAAGAEATCIDLRDFAMPLYDGDLEAAHGLPEGAVRLRAVVQAHDALVVVSPEYNASIPAVLKNALDWLSRPYSGAPGESVFRDKVAGLMSSSPGALGGLRALVHLRQILMNLGMLVVTEQFALGHADQAFAPDGGIADAKHAAAVQKVLLSVVRIAARLRG